jgi:hypothetical protein
MMKTVTILTKMTLIQTLFINLHLIYLKKKMMNSSRTRMNKKRKKCLLPYKMKKNRKSKNLSLMKSKLISRWIRRKKKRRRRKFHSHHNLF